MRMGNYYYATGGRKTSVAKVFLKPGGKGKILVNGSSPDNYFGNIYPEVMIKRPFEITRTWGEFDIKADIKGGGKSAQLQALVHGIAKALAEYNPEWRRVLKKEGLLARDPRKKERKKYGQPGRRKQYQYHKR